MLVAGLAAYEWSALHAPAASEGSPRLVSVEPGAGLHEIARELDAHGLLPRRLLLGPRALVWYARLTGRDRQIKSGEYELDPTQTPAEILAKLVSGEVRTWPVTLPEGLRLDEVAARLEEAGLVRGDALLARARDADFAHSLGVEAPTLEGYLYPETYRFRRGTPPEEILARMVEELEARLGPQERMALRASDRTLHQTLTLASLVEKETAHPAERQLIAAVFENRLRRGMRLQSDPTVIYGLVAQGGFDGNLRRRDLEADTPWNTYTRAGLPPGPIASATIESIRAVLEPAPVPYLYFVSRNDGTHEFSATLDDHNRAVARYQRTRPPG